MTLSTVLGHARQARAFLLAVAATLGALCLVWLAAALVLHAHVLVFRSGSMSPTIDTGALAVARNVPASELAVGDIVSVTTAGGTRVTHRIVGLDRSDRSALLTLKGDANATADAEPYRVRTADRVVFSIPRLGYVAGWTVSPFGLIALGVYAALLLQVIVRGGSAEPPAPRDALPAS